MSNLNIARTALIAAAAALTLTLSACGSDSEQRVIQQETLPSSTDMTSFSNQLSCEGQGLVENPYMYDEILPGPNGTIIIGSACLTHEELAVESDARRAANESLAVAKADLVAKVTNAYDQLPMILDNFCGSDFRSAQYTPIDGEHTGFVSSYAEQAGELWRTYWFAANSLELPYNFAAAVDIRCDGNMGNNGHVTIEELSPTGSSSLDDAVCRRYNLDRRYC